MLYTSHMQSRGCPPTYYICRLMLHSRLKNNGLVALMIVFVGIPFSVLGKPLRCEVLAPSAILINADTGQVLYEKQARIPTFPASTTKIATALYSLYLKGDRPDDLVQISSNAVSAVSPAIRRGGKHPSYRLEFGGSHMSLRTGEQISFNSLLHGLLVCSGNDAANAIAEYVSGSVPKFMEGMNVYLQSIGCLNTHFQNPHGLPDSEHLTTAYDLARIAHVAMRNAFFCEVVKTTRYLRPKTNVQEQSVLIQSNALLKSGKFFYPYAMGIKTGYTVAAGSNIVAAAQKGDRRVIAVVLNCEDSSQRYRSCIGLFEAAFQEVKVERKLLSQEYDSFSRVLDGASSRLEGVLSRDVSIEYYPSEESSLSAKCCWDVIELPIKKGDRVGEIQVANAQGDLVLTEPVLAKDSVEPTISYCVGRWGRHMMLYVQQNKSYLGGILGFAMILSTYVIFRSNKRIIQ